MPKSTAVATAAAAVKPRTRQSIPMGRNTVLVVVESWATSSRLRQSATARRRSAPGCHLGRWSPRQAIDFLVERVGHERANAEGEVRRTTIDAPLYQVAYLVGGLQLRVLAHELVGSKKVTLAEFHDRVLRGGHRPIELVRARLSGRGATAEMRPTWRFDGAPR